MKNWIIAILIALPLAAQPSPEIRQRIDSLIAAMNGTPEAYEAYAQEAFTPAALAKSDAPKRRRIHEMVRKDFGQMQVRGVDRSSDTRLEIEVEGSTRERGTITLDIEAAPPHHITGMGMRVGGPDQRGPSLPPIPIRGDMPAADQAKALDTYITNLAKAGAFSGTVLVARDGKPVFEQAYGLANRADAVPNTPKTRHNLGSINKQFTRAAIGQLAAAGKLSLEETLGKYLPDHAQVDARKATIAQLLDHTAGLGDFFGPEFRNAEKSTFRSNSDYYKFIAPRPMTFAPGAGKQYCNACYIALGEIITRVSGVPYEQYIAEHVLRPAGMNDSGFFLVDEVVPRVAMGYAETPDGVKSNVYMRGAGGSAAGGAFATAADLLALDNALRDGRLLDPKWTGWFFGDDQPLTTRSDASLDYAGGSGGINAGVSGNGKWTVVAMANIGPPAAEALAEEIFRALTAQ